MRYQPNVKSTFLIVATICGLSNFVPSSFAVELSVSNVKVHLLDKLDKRWEAGQIGLAEQFSPPEGKRFLCVQLDVVAENWKDDDRTINLKHTDFTLRFGEEETFATARHLMPGYFLLSVPRLYINRPAENTTKVTQRKFPVFLVPKDFSKGTLQLGPSVKVEISAKDAVPVGLVADYAKFRVTKAAYVDSVPSRESYQGNKYTSLKKPAHGKLLAVTVDVAALKPNHEHGRLMLTTQHLSLEFAGAFTPTAGQDHNGRMRRDMANYVTIGETKSMVFYFVVSEKIRRANLLFHGAKVAEVSPTK